MTQDEYEAKCNAVLDRLENARPMRSIVASSSLRSLTQACHVLYHLGFVASTTTVSMVALTPSKPGVGLAIGVVLFGIVSAFSEAIFDEMDKERPGTYMKRGLLGLAGVSEEMSEAKAREMANWSQKYPRMRDIFAKWGAQTRDGRLGQDHHAKAEKAVEKLTRLSEHRDVIISEEKTREGVHQIMQESGLAAAVCAKKLSADTAGATRKSTHKTRL